MVVLSEYSEKTCSSSHSQPYLLAVAQMPSRAQCYLCKFCHSPNQVPTPFQLFCLLYVSGVSLGILFEYLDQRFTQKKKSSQGFVFLGSLYKAGAFTCHLVCTQITVKTDISRTLYRYSSLTLFRITVIYILFSDGRLYLLPLKSTILMWLGSR